MRAAHAEQGRRIVKHGEPRRIPGFARCDKTYAELLTSRQLSSRILFAADASRALRAAAPRQVRQPLQRGARAAEMVDCRSGSAAASRRAARRSGALYLAFDCPCGPRGSMDQPEGVGKGVFPRHSGTRVFARTRNSRFPGSMQSLSSGRALRGPVGNRSGRKVPPRCAKSGSPSSRAGASRRGRHQDAGPRLQLRGHLNKASPA